MSRTSPAFAFVASVLLVSLSPHASAQEHLWTVEFGTPFWDFGRGVARDGTGGAYVSAMVWGSLGGQNAGRGDFVVARYDGSGNQLWVDQFGSSLHDEPMWLVEDGSGGGFVIGRTVGNIGGQHFGEFDAFLARYDNLGNQLCKGRMNRGVGEVLGREI